MIRYREILRLYSQGISKTAIAQSCECSRNTVAKVVQRAEEVGLTWPLAPELSDAKFGVCQDSCRMNLKYDLRI